MKLSTKIILPIILISALLILLSGCFGVPADEQPGVTPPTYTVTYDGNGNTGGVVPVGPVSYVEGATVTVLDNTGNLVKTGHDFAGWNTAADGSGTYYFPGDSFIMGTANVTIYAQWATSPGYGPGPAPTPAPIVYYDLTMAVLPVEGGTATDVTASGPYAGGTVVSISAVAEECYEFVGWTAVPAVIFDDASVADTTFTMPGQDVTVTANFVPTTYELTMAADPVEGGTATDVTGSGPYAGGTVVSISAAAEECYEFVGWTAVPAVIFDEASVADTTFTMPCEDVTVTANFVKITYTIIASVAGPGGSISPSGSVTVDCGTDKIFTITPDPVFYSIDDVLVDGLSVGAVDSHTFTNVKEDHTISASFTLEGPVYNQDKDKHYGTIQAAINDADPNNTILVMAGTYSEVVEVDESVTLLGANAGVCAGVDPGIRGAESIVDAFKISVNDVVIDGFQINGAKVGGSGDDINAIYIASTSGHIISNNILPGPGGTGTPIAKTRGIVSEGGFSDATVTCNEIYGWFSGIYINPTSDLLYQYNSIHHNWAGIGSDGLSDVSILNNDFSDNVEGFGSSNVGINVESHFNNFTTNGAGINWYSGNNIDAIDNWWGDITGPNHPVTNPGGLGDAVSTNVDYIPWSTVEH